MTELERAIRAQPDELRRVAGLELPPHARRLAAGERLWLVGTGTSLHAAELGAAMMERAGIDARFASSMDFARRAPLRAGDGVIVLSHTGDTAYARASRRRALDLGAETLVGRDTDGLLDGVAAAAEAEGIALALLADGAGPGGGEGAGPGGGEGAGPRGGGSGPPADELLAQIPLTVRLQLLALRRAEAGGHDPDTVITGAWAADALWSVGAP